MFGISDFCLRMIPRSKGCAHFWALSSFCHMVSRKLAAIYSLILKFCGQHGLRKKELTRQILPSFFFVSNSLFNGKDNLQIVLTKALFSNDSYYSLNNGFEWL